MSNTNNPKYAISNEVAHGETKAKANIYKQILWQCD